MAKEAKKNPDQVVPTQQSLLPLAKRTRSAGKKGSTSNSFQLEDDDDATSEDEG